MMLKYITILLTSFVLISGCSSSGPGSLFSTKEKLDIQPREATIKNLVTVDDQRFSIDIPEGWVIETTGDFQNFGFRAYDPNRPSRTIFYYGTMSPWMKSEEAKTFWMWYAQSGYPGSKVYADAPVLYDASVEGLYYGFDAFTEFARAYGIQHNFPSFSSMEVLEQFVGSTEMAPNALDETVLRLRLNEDGYPIDAFVTATLVNAMTYPANGIDAGYYTAYRISGIMAPADDLLYHQDLLIQSLASFKYSEAYINEGVRLIEWGTEQAKQLQKTLNQTSQIINDTLANRNRVNDAANAKFITYIRGKGYLQDPDTGETYEASNDFIDTYMKDPSQYNKSNLKPLLESSPTYGQAVTGVINN